MTPDEYCDGIIGIAFDRETTGKAFEAGRLDYASEHEHDLTIAHMDGYSKGRDATLAELARQKPVAYGYPNTAITGNAMSLMMVRLGIPSDDQYGGAQWVPLYAAPPDMRELVEALELCYEHCRVYHPEVERNNVGQAVTALLTKHRGQS